MKKLLAISIMLMALVSVNVATVDAASTNRSQATRMAKQYLGTMAFSKSGLVEQLQFEGFSRSDANWGASHAGANWLTQAVKMARQYLKTMPFSRSGLIDQLEFEGFTSYQAAYGVSRAY